MTINIGWHQGGTVFLIADTAITHRHEPYSQLTSFSELVVHEKARTVEERHSKIVPLDTHTLAAISGNMAAATEFIEELKHDNASDLAVAITNVALRLETDKRGAFALLIGTYRGHSTRLIQFHSSVPAATTDIPELFAGLEFDDAPESPQDRSSDKEDAQLIPKRVAVVGSASDSLKFLASLMVTVMTAQETDADRLLVGAVGFMQSQGIRNYLMETGVGGAMLGAFVDRRGINWLPDVTYQIIDSVSHAMPVEDDDDPRDPDPDGDALEGQPQRVSCVVRDGVGYVVSSYHPSRILILEPYTFDGMPPYPVEEREAFIEHLSLGDHPFFVLISSRTGDVMIVDRRVDKEAYVAVRSRALFYSETVVDFFSKPQPPGGPARIVFRPARAPYGPGTATSDGKQNALEARRARNRRKRERRQRRTGC